MSRRGWIVSVAAHACAGALLIWHPNLNLHVQKGEEMQTIAIALAALPVQPPPPPPPPPPPAAPEPPQAQEEIPLIESKAPEPDPDPDPPPPKPEPPKPKLVERPPPPKPKPPEKKPEPPKPMPEPLPQQTATQPAAEPQPTYRPAPPAPVVAAAPVAVPMPAAPRMAPDPSLEANYLGLLVATLEKHKEYPRRAQQRRQQGTVQLRFQLNRDGSISSYSVHRSSGYRLLDEAVIEMIQRATPLPPIPVALNKSVMDIVLPVNFTMPY